ncbi:hypothetical protein [Roseibacillus ishigakijimensis]|uniref:Autotransporter-associated beta strand repeat-containing protein n=1 Tax=Roseibacillus ishigakijimensis TaxID=454146 RepID=A0A934RLD5_9BACT|nr:hypothetical protein [Roseibacillus ishigakijimensis]MBK1833534.1 hypothetical protein [Roseibacillus ishigakijimensis]
MKTKAIVLSLASLPLSPLTLSGQSLIVKDNVGSEVDFELGASWVGGIAPGSNDRILIDSTLEADKVFGRLGADLSVAGLKVNDPQSANITSGYTLSSRLEEGVFLGTLSLGAEGIDFSEAQAPDLSPPFNTLGWNSFFSISTSLTLTADQEWNIPRMEKNPSRELNIAGSTGSNPRVFLDLGGHELTKSGDGIVTFAFNRDIANGSLALTGGTALFVNSHNGSNSSDLSLQVAESFSATVESPGTLVIGRAPGEGEVDWQADIALNGGTLHLAGDNYGGALALDGSLTLQAGSESTLLYTNAAPGDEPLHHLLNGPLAGSGTLRLEGSSSRTRDLIVLAGNDSTFNGSLITFGGSYSIENSSGSATGTGTLDVDANALLTGNGTTGPVLMAGFYYVEPGGRLSGLTVNGSLTFDDAVFDMPADIELTRPIYIVAQADSITGEITPFNALPEGYELEVVTVDSGQQLWLTNGQTYDPYGEWLADYPSLTAEESTLEADPDGDGLPNQIEFVLGSSPLSGTRENLPHIDSTGDSYLFTYTQRADLALASMETVVQVSPNLEENSWTEVASSFVSSEDNEETRQATLTLPPGESRLFARLLVRPLQ